MHQALRFESVQVFRYRLRRIFQAQAMIFGGFVYILRSQIEEV
jgi:hypothetical protein